MPALANQRLLRQRQFAMGKNAFIESEFLMEAEPIVIPSKQKIEPGNQSPISIASDIFLPEIKPITLPGAWTVVGKGGRPVKNAKMYDEPKKKKKRSRTRKPKDDENATLFATLEEMPSSSHCLYTLHRAEVRTEKSSVRGRQLKVWKRSKEVKALRGMARDTLLLNMVDAGLLNPDDAPASPPQLPSHRHMGSSAEKKRRGVRQARQAAKCFSVDEWDVEDQIFSSAPARTKRATTKRGAPSQRAGMGDARAEAAMQEPHNASASPNAKGGGRMKRLRTASAKLGKAAVSPTGKQCLVM